MFQTGFFVFELMITEVATGEHTMIAVWKKKINIQEIIYLKNQNKFIHAQNQGWNEQRKFVSGRVSGT